MSEKVTIEKVFNDTVQTKYGTKPKTSIYTTEYPGVRMSSFDKGAYSWKVGDVVEITIEKNGQFVNFRVGAGAPSGTGGSNVEARLKKLEDAVFGPRETETKEDVTF